MSQRMHLVLLENNDYQNGSVLLISILYWESKFQCTSMGSPQPTLSPKYFQTDTDIPNPLRRPKQRHLVQHGSFLQRSNTLKLAPNPFLPSRVYLGSSRGFHTVKQESKDFRPGRQTLPWRPTELSKTSRRLKLNRPESLSNSWKRPALCAGHRDPASNYC